MTFVDVFTVALFGHREIDDLRRLEKKLIPVIENLIRTKSFVSFWIGRHGEFDEFAASVIKSVQRKTGAENSELVLVLPYTIAHLSDYENYYDQILIPECIYGLHPKAIITAKNQYMIDQCDLAVFYVERTFGGAYAAMKYAKKKNKETLNLFYDDLVQD